MARKSIAYVLWLIGGYFGLHHFYLGRDRQAFFYCCTLAGFGFGWLRDLFKIPTYVADANKDSGFVNKLLKKMQQKEKPPFSILRFSSQVLLGYLLGNVYYSSVPEENLLGKDWTCLRFFTPFAISLGVHNIGNIGHEQGRFREPLYTSVLVWILNYNNMPGGIVWCTLAASVVFQLKARKWRQIDGPKWGFMRRLMTLGSCTLVIFALVASGIYFNVEVKNAQGETIKFRDAMLNLYNSPLWEESKESIRMMRNFYNAHGAWKTIEFLTDQLDPLGERRALKTLGLSSSSSKPEIVARWRQLSREWHPDRQKDPAKKEEAQRVFMDYQAAYQKLIKIRGKFRAAPLSTTDSSPRDDL